MLPAGTGGNRQAPDFWSRGAFNEAMRMRLWEPEAMRGHNRHGVLAAVACGLLGLQAFPAQPARADVNGFGPDESIQAAAGPLLAGTTYTGGFSSPQDVDYLFFKVPQPETLRFDLVNTLASCPETARPEELQPEHFCPLWGTLIDGNGQQLGGEGSAAGTGPVEYSSYEDVEWAFSQPGRYYVVLESSYEGTMPTFQLSYGVVSPGGTGGTGGTGGAGGTGGGTGGGGTGPGGAGAGAGGSGGLSGAGGGGAPQGGVLRSGEVGLSEGRPSRSFAVSGSRSLIRSLTLPWRQRGTHVVVTVVLAQRLASLDLQLLARVGPHRRLTVVGHRLRRHPIAGRERMTLPVSRGRWLTSRRYGPLVLRVRATAADGSAELVQGRLLLRR
jgi:hypothetical protein